MKAIAIDHEVRLVDTVVPPVREGWALCKVLAAMIGPIDRSVILGQYPVDPGRILGSFGVVRVIEPGVGSDLRPGEVLGIQPFCRNYVLVHDIDGVMADYASLPRECFVRIPRALLSNEAPLWLEFSYVGKLRKYAINKDVLIIGCSLNVLVISNYLRNYADVTVGCTHRGLLSKIASLGVEVVTIDKILLKDKRYDVVIVDPLSWHQILDVERFLKNDGYLIIVPTCPKTIVSVTGSIERFTIVNPSLGDIIAGKEAFTSIPKSIREKAYVVSNDLGQVPSLIRYFSRVIYVKS